MTPEMYGGARRFTHPTLTEKNLVQLGFNAFVERECAIDGNWLGSSLASPIRKGQV